ncbi:XAC2610-related protein [Pseudomonas ovata]|uniref:XAC2610-related protein n=1 Tax=Pseudomonas ovata TaxID=1839709 RepID=UPI000D68F987
MPFSITQRTLTLLAGLLLSMSASAIMPVTGYGEMDVPAFEATARKTYALQDFSKQYRATLEIADNDEVFRPGIVRVFDRQNPAPLFEVRSDELVLDVNPGGEVKANVQQLPYGEQSVLIYKDFNFDGIKDLAVMDGQNSCYHGPSFEVFVGTEHGFRHSAAFTQLAQDYCGMFQVDEQARRVKTMTKDGCCTHWFATYIIKDGEPVMERETVIDQTSSSGLARESRSVNRNGKMVEDGVERTLWEDDEQRQELLAFRLAPSGKRIVLFRSAPGERVYYAAVDSKNEVSLLYPEQETERFELDSGAQVLSFVRGDTTYRILGDAQGVVKGMDVVIRGKTTALKVQPGSSRGSLAQVQEALKAAP